MNEEVATNHHHFIAILQLTYCENQITMCVGYEERLQDKAISEEDDVGVFDGFAFDIRWSIGFTTALK